MALNHLHHLTMEKSSSANKNQNSFHSLVLTLLFHKIFTWFDMIHSFCSRSWYFPQSQLESVDSKTPEEKSRAFQRTKSSVNEKKADESLSREELDMVMRELAVFCSPESGELPQRLSSSELFGLFEDKEPTSEEVREAFDVFDENKDGFIDASDLQKVLCMLHIKEGFELENCGKMIGTFDQDGDGRIDFEEFVKFMENCFC